MNRYSPAAAAVFMAILSCGTFGRQQSGTPLVVEPSGLERRQDLVGREVVVDDRVAYYVPRGGSEDDELQLKRTPMTFRVPRSLRPAAHTRMPVAVVRGVLEREGTRLVCRVKALEVKPADLERLKSALDQLGPQDYQTRRAWARWAERRAQEFKDEALMRRAKDLEAEVLRMQGEVKRVAVDAPEEWLAMAREARQRKVPEPEPSAQAHRALRARLAAAADARVIAIAAGPDQGVLPGRRLRPGIGTGTPGNVGGRVCRRPDRGLSLGAPRDPQGARPSPLGRCASQRLLELEPIPDLATAVARSEEAAEQLPENPELPARLLEQGLAAARRELPPCGSRRSRTWPRPTAYG